MQPGDVKKTYADIEKSKIKLGFSPKINIQKGIDSFLDWFFQICKTYELFYK